MPSFLLPVAHLSILVFLILAAIQDYKTREVSNWLTIPLLLGGLIAMLANPKPLPGILSLLMFFFWHKGWMGGADAKVLIALVGLWYPAALVAFFLLGVWGLILLFRKTKKTFPGLVAIAVATGLTFIREVSIMLLN